MGWTFYNASGQRLSTAATSITNLDIDGATDIGADIVDADLFIIDDGAGGTNRKTEASRIKTYAGTTQADQAALEAETNEDTYAPPDLIKHSPGVAKGYLRIASDGASHSGAYNVASVTDTNVGRRTVVWDVDFSDTAYTFLVTDGAQATNSIFRTGGPTATGSVPLLILNYDFSGYVDGDTGNAAFGDQ